MYYNKSKTYVQLVINTVIMVPFFVLSFVFLADLILMLTNQIETTDSLTYPLVIFFACTFLFVFLSTAKKLFDIIRVIKMCCFMKRDDDGLILIKDLAGYMKMNQKKCFSFFIKSIGKGLLVNCSLFQEDPTYILLDNGKDTILKKYTVVHCPKCGAPSTLRIGFEKSCKYCGVDVLPTE